MSSLSCCSPVFSLASSFPLLRPSSPNSSAPFLSLRRTHSTMTDGTKLPSLSSKKDPILSRFECRASSRAFTVEDESLEGSPANVLEKEASWRSSASGEQTMLSLFGPARDSFKEDPDALASEHKLQMTLADLLEKSGISPLAVYGDPHVIITGVQDDSRQISQEDLFVFCDEWRPCHSNLAEACARGASAVVVGDDGDKDQLLRWGAKVIVVVNATRPVSPILAATFHGHPSRRLFVVAVTGTNGKTTTTNMVRSIFEAMGYNTGLFGTIGILINGDEKLETSLTTPMAVTAQSLMAKMIRAGTGALVMEASSEGLEEGRCEELDLNVAVFTNFTRDHLDYHGTMEAYRRSKGRLFAKMTDPRRHRKVVNIDDPNASYFIEHGSADVPVVTFGVESENADVRPLSSNLSLFKSAVSVRTPKGTVEITSGMLGRYNIFNMLAAVAVGIAVGARLEDIARGIEGLKGVAGRFELIDEGQAFAVIVDYAHTPDALERLLDAVRELGPKRLISVFGCGGERDRGKRPLMAQIGAEKSDTVILTSDNPRNEDPKRILDDMLAGVGLTMEEQLQQGENNSYRKLQNGCTLLVQEDRRAALDTAIAMGKEGDIIVVAGKGHETYQVEGDTKKFFDDRVECREALRRVREMHRA